MKITLNVILILLMIAFFTSSCKEKKNSIALLDRAQNLLDNNPEQALLYLDSIQNPQDMGQENYMQYIVALVKAKKILDLSIENYNQIFKAQKYFNDKADYKNAAEANYYAAWVYYENNEYSKFIESFFQSAFTAEKSDNKLLAGRSFNNIGYFYYEQTVYDSAIVNYKKALSYYDQLDGIEKNKLKVFINVGNAYGSLHKEDSAIVYFDKCLALARSINDKDYEFYSVKNLGVAFYEKGLYERSTEYLNKALAMDSISDELSIGEINLYLLNSYNKQRDIPKAKQYVDFIEVNINKITDPYTVKEMYGALSQYYSQADDYKQALYYANQEKLTKGQIEADSRAEELLRIDNDVYLSQQQKKNQELKINLYIYGAIIVFVVLALLIFVSIMLTKNKNNKIKMQELIQNYDNLKSKIKP